MTAVVGQETPGGHHLERPGLGADVDKTCAAVDPGPLLDRVELHPGADVAEEHLAGLAGGWFAQ